MPKSPAYAALSAYLDATNATAECIGFLHRHKLRGDLKVIVLADTPENRATLEAGGLHIQPSREDERRTS